jgi:hypothetical protein
MYLISELPKMPFGIATQSYPKAVNLLNSKPGLKNWLLASSNGQLATMEVDPLLITNLPGNLDQFFKELDKIEVSASELDVLQTWPLSGEPWAWSYGSGIYSRPAIGAVVCRLLPYLMQATVISAYR